MRTFCLQTVYRNQGVSLPSDFHVSLSMGQLSVIRSIWLPVQDHRAADNRGIRCEAAAPEIVTEYYHRVASLDFIFRRHDEAALLRLDAQNRKVITAYRLSPCALGFAGSAQAGGDERKMGRNALENVFGLVAVVDVVRV